MAKSSVISTDETVVAKKRTTRKRVVASDLGADADVSNITKTRVRKPRPPKLKDDEVSLSKTVTNGSTTRRAPTPLRAEKIAYKKNRRVFFVVVLCLFIVFGLAFIIGASDRGQIDVVAVVNDRNERVGRGEVRDGEGAFTVPVQNSDNRPNGGLVPAEAVPPVLDNNSQPATTTTEITATSSSDMIENASSTNASTTNSLTDEEIAEGV